MRNAVVLLSGGLDSATVLALARSAGYTCHCLTVSYGQRHSIELTSAKRVAIHLGATDHRIIELPGGIFGGSALTTDLPVPKDNPPHKDGDPIPLTYVPARNTVLLSLALALAESIRAEDIFIGVNALDYSGYPDCRPEFIKAFEALARVATKAGVEGNAFRVHTPLISLSKADIICKAMEHGVDIGMTHSCYDPTPEGFACGRCDSCLIRIRAFEELGLEDPALAHLRVS